MEKQNSTNTTIHSSLQNLNINSTSTSSKNYKPITSSPIQTPAHLHRRLRPPSLARLCIAVIGQHLEDVIPELDEILFSFPSYIKMTIAAIARRRKLLNDDVILSLVDSSWEILDISGSDVSDYGLAKVAEICRSLRAVDISQCSKITPNGVSQMVQHCRSLETLRCGGCPRSNYTAKKCLEIFKPELNNVEGDSWEELDTSEISNGEHSLQWLVWENIDSISSKKFSLECPRVKVNPKSSHFRGVTVPREALPQIVMDDPMVEDINPRIWATSEPTMPTTPQAYNSGGLSVAEKFRLAFEERDMRLAPKRAKNARQRQRRAEKEWMMSTSEGKAAALASQASKSLRGRN